MSADIRSLYIRFVLHLLLTGDTALVSKVAELKGFVSAIFKLMKKDSIEVCACFLECSLACGHHRLVKCFPAMRVIKTHVSRDGNVTPMTYFLMLAGYLPPPPPSSPPSFSLVVDRFASMYMRTGLDFRVFAHLWVYKRLLPSRP